MKIHAVLHEAYSALKTSIDNHEEKLEAQLLLLHACAMNHAWLIAHAQDTIEAKTHVAFEALLQRRLTGEPIAYILGAREFYGLPLNVTSDTLIPRPDTETLVDAALEKIPKNQPTKILDLGTGTGAIALAIAQHRQHAQVTAVDNNQMTLEVAIGNAKNLQITNVNFMQSNWFAKIKTHQFDMIVSNPPYIEENDPHLKQGDLRFEPTSALVSGDDGLDDIRNIVTNATNYLKPNGWLMLEHGYNQTKAVTALLLKASLHEVSTQKDLGGNDRVTLGCSI